MKPEQIALAQKLRVVRESKRLSQDYIAAKIGVTQADYSKIENAKISVGDKIENILSAMDLTLDNFNNANPYTVNIYNNKFEEQSTANIVNQINNSEKSDVILEKLEVLIDLLIKKN